MNPDELRNRTKQFALRIMRLVEKLPTGISGRTIGGQIVRSGTSVAANYRATCKARSRAEFIAKIGVVEEEADESAFWLELIIEGNLLSSRSIMPLLNEANELAKIMGTSRLTAAGRRSTERNRQSAIGNRQ